MKENKKQYYRFGTYGLVVIGVGLLASCAPQANYQKPDIALPDHYRVQDSLVTHNDSIAQTQENVG